MAEPCAKKPALAAAGNRLQHVDQLGAIDRGNSASSANAQALDALALTIPEFCRAHRISRAHFYALLRQGQGPRLMRVGTRRLVSIEAAADWRRLMEVSHGRP